MRKIMLVSNAAAGSVSRWSKEVIVKALQADFKLEVSDTTHRNHASDLAAEAVDRGFDVVVAFGGDGTINEVAQGLVGTEAALALLPGGSTNVMARSLGIPPDPVEATAYLIERLRSRTSRRIAVGRFGTRYFLFSAGLGLDGEVVKRVEADPEAKRRRGEWFFLSNAVRAALGSYVRRPPWITVEVEGREPARVVLAICANGRPFTYFKRFPVDVFPEAHLDERLDVFGLTRVSLSTVPRIAWSVFASQSHIGWKSAVYYHDIPGFRLVADHPGPAQVDGDYIGEMDEVAVEHLPDALDLVF